MVAGVDDAHAHGHAVDGDGQRDRLSRALQELLEERARVLDELGVVVGDVGHGDGCRAEVVVVRRRVAHEELGRLEGAHHAVGGHAQQPCVRGDLVDRPLAVVDVEQREDREAACERTHGERIGLPFAVQPAAVAVRRPCLCGSHSVPFA